MNPHTIGDRVVVELDPPETETEGGLVIPDSAQGEPVRGTVRAVSETGVLLSSGEYRPVAVDVGDRVLVKRHSGTQIQLSFDGEEEKEYEVFREADILLKWEDG